MTPKFAALLKKTAFSKIKEKAKAKAKGPMLNTLLSAHFS